MEGPPRRPFSLPGAGSDDRPRSRRAVGVAQELSLWTRSGSSRFAWKAQLSWEILRGRCRRRTSRQSRSAAPRAPNARLARPAYTERLPPCWRLLAVNRHRPSPHRKARSEATTPRRPEMRAHTISTQARVGGIGRMTQSRSRRHSRAEPRRRALGRRGEHRERGDRVPLPALREAVVPGVDRRGGRGVPVQGEDVRSEGSRQPRRQ